MAVLERERDGWKFVADVALDKPVNWDAVECGESLERCHHVDGFHEGKD